MALLEINLQPDDKQLRGFGLIGLVVFGGLGAWALYRGTLLGFGLGEARSGAAFGLFGLASLCGALAAAWPRGLKPLFVGLTVLTAPIGFVVSHVIMLALFFLVITPIGLFMRAFGWDAMERALDRQAESYWKKRAAPPPVDRYFRQF